MTCKSEIWQFSIFSQLLTDYRPAKINVEISENIQKINDLRDFHRFRPRHSAGKASCPAAAKPEAPAAGLELDFISKNARRSAGFISILLIVPIIPSFDGNAT
jgi:hypothetical protein